MKIRYFLVTCLFFTFHVPQVKAQSEAAALFLLIHPSLRANGMAGASVASAEHDALSVAMNPAHIGLATLERSINLEFYPSKTNWLPVFNLPGLNFDAKSFLVGYNLQRLNKAIPLSIAFGYTRIVINLGRQIITSETSPEPIGFFDSSENANIFTFGIGLDTYVKFGLGFSFKNIESNLAGPNVAGDEFVQDAATATMHDFGLLLHVPIIESIAKLSKKEFEIAPGFRPYLMPGFGFSKSNIGDTISFVDASQADPLPRVARMGFSVNAGITYSNDDVSLRVVGVEWSSEAEDVLVTRDASGFTYESGTGEISFFDNVLGGNANRNVQNSQGWELNLLQFISIRHGRLKDPAGLRFVKSDGFGIRLAGALKLAGILSPHLLENEIFGFVSRHFDIQYNTSSFDAGSGHPLDGTKFNGIRVSIF